MKKFNLFLLIATILFSVTACNDHDDDDYFNVGMGTLEKSNQMYRIAFDGADTYNVPDSTLLVYKKLQTPGQRVIAMFNIIGDGRSGKAIRLRDIYGVLTKDFIQKPADLNEDQKLGNDVVNVAQAWVSGGYLNLKFSFPTGKFTNQPHLMNAFDTGTRDAEGYALLEFRHNLNGNVPQFWSSYHYISFKLPETEEKVKGYKLRYKYSSSETRIIKVDD